MAAMRPLTLLLALLAMTACAMMPRVTVAEASSANDLANAAAAEERWADQLDAMTVDPVAIQRIGEEDDENRAMMELEAELDSAVEAEAELDAPVTPIKAAAATTTKKTTKKKKKSATKKKSVTKKKAVTKAATKAVKKTATKAVKKAAAPKKVKAAAPKKAKAAPKKASATKAAPKKSATKAKSAKAAKTVKKSAPKAAKSAQTRKVARSATTTKAAKSTKKVKTSKASKSAQTGAPKTAKTAKTAKAAKKSKKNKGGQTALNVLGSPLGQLPKATKASKSSKSSKATKASKSSKATKSAKKSSKKSASAKSGKSGKATKASKKSSKTSKTAAKKATKASKTKEGKDGSKKTTKKKTSKSVLAKRAPAAERLSDKEQKAKWAAHLQSNPQKKFKSAAEEAAAFKAFKENRGQIVADNDKFGNEVNPTPFRSAGPLAAMTPAQFRARLNAKNPKKRSGGKGVKPRPRKARAAKGKGKAAGAAKKSTKKARFLMEMHAAAMNKPRGGAGGSVGAAGGAVGAAGGAVGAAGGAVGAAGGAVGAAGGAVGAAGGAVGAAGGAVGAAGGAVGAAGGAVGAAGGAVGAGGGAVGAAGGAVGAGGGAVGAGGGAVGAGGGAVGAGGGAVGAGGGAVGAGGGAVGEGVIVAPTSSRRETFAISRGNLGETLERIGAAGFSGLPVKVSIAKDPVEQQGQCGSCWAQTAINSFEVALKKAGKYKEPLSVQQLLDCVKLTDTDGCNGGTPMDGLDWLQNNAAATEREYPYTGVVGTCVESRGSIRSAGWNKIVTPCLSGACSSQYKQEGQLLKQLSELKVPLVAYVDAATWQNYGGGIFPAERCSSSNEAGNHVVEITGAGDEKGNAYWVVRNSWGSSWGERGYIRLPMGVNACGIANFVVNANPL